MEASTKSKIGALLLVVGMILPVALYFTSVLPAQVRYSRFIGGDISITIDQPTTAGMAAGLARIWNKMNATFGTADHDSIYGSGYYWDQTPDNSLASEDRYFRAEIDRLNNYTTAYQSYIQSGTKIVIGLPLTDWYDKVDSQSRGELQRNGGLDWAISGAWFLKYEPFAYWFGLYATAIAGVFFLFAIVLWVSAWRQPNSRF